MRKKWMSLVAATVLLLVSVLFSACGEDPAILPIEKTLTEAQKSIEFDLASEQASQKERTLNVSTYIDANGAEDLTFSVTASNDFVEAAMVTTGANAGKQFKVAAKAVGTTEVSLVAKRGDQTLLTVKITVTVVNTKFNVTAFTPSENAGYTLDFDAIAKKGEAYAFSIEVDPLYVVVSGGAKATYAVGDGVDKEVAGVLSADTCTFTIPSSEIVDDIEIKSITGIELNTAEQTTVEGLDIKGDFTVAGTTYAFVNKDYVFKVNAPSYYESVTATYKIGAAGTEKQLTATASANGMNTEFLFAVPKAELNKDNAVVLVSVDCALKTKNLPDSFWGADAWEDVTGLSGQSKPTDNEGVLEFTSTIIRRQGNSSAPAISGAPGDSWAQHSFEAKTEGDIDMVFWATSTLTVNNTTTPTQWKTGNWLRLFTANGRVFLSHAQGAIAGEVRVKDETLYTAGAWTRFDLLYYRPATSPNNGIGEVRLFINGKWAEVEKFAATHEARASVVAGNLRLDIGATQSNQNWGDRSAVWAGEKTLYVRKVATPAVG